MASVNDVPAEHRSAASRITHLDRMPAEEARHRARHVAALEEKAPLTGEGRQLVMAHTSRLLSALPVREYLDRVGQLNELAAQLPGGIDGAGHDARQAALALKAGNTYVPGLLENAGKRLLGKEPTGYTECDLDQVLGLTTEKTKAPKASPRDAVSKAVEKALAGLDAKERQLRKDINDWKAKIAADYLAAGLSIPASLNLPKERHPKLPAVAKAESEAEKFRAMAEGISEPELRQHFLAKAQEADAKAEAIREGI